MLQQLHFTDQHVSLVLLCVGSAFIGGIIHIALIRCDFSRRPTKLNEVFDRGQWYEEAVWVAGRIIISLGTGLAVGLYHIGLITESPPSRVLLAALLLGAAAPNLWKAQSLIKVMQSQNK